MPIVEVMVAGLSAREYGYKAGNCLLIEYVKV